MKKIRPGRVTIAARKQTIRTVFREFGWILKKLKHADDDMKDLCTIKSVTALEQLIRQVLITLIETGKIPPGKLVKGELPGPERPGGISLAQHIAFSQNFQNMDAVKNILREIGMSHVFDCLCESDRAALKALFKHRHDIVHTSVKLPPIDINRCFGAVLALINCIMSEIYPGGHHYCLYMGDCMSHLREYREAITYYNLALAIRRDDPYILGKIGEAFAGLGLHNRAVECYNRAIALDPGSPVHARKGESLAELDRHREAVECYNLAIAMNPDDPFAYTKKGESLAKLERFGEAVECYNRAIALNPNDPRVHVLKGESLARMDKHEEAIICYNRALTLDPGNSHAYVLKGVSLASMDKHEEAIIHYDRGLDIHPDDPYALARKGESLARWLLCFNPENSGGTHLPKKESRLQD